MRSVSAWPGPSIASVLKPRLENSRPANRTLISLQLSMPLNSTTVGAGPETFSAFRKYAGSMMPSNGTLTRSMFG
jgi:hypothetical protein